MKMSDFESNSSSGGSSMTTSSTATTNDTNEDRIHVTTLNISGNGNENSVPSPLEDADDVKESETFQSKSMSEVTIERLKIDYRRGSLTTSLGGSKFQILFANNSLLAGMSRNIYPLAAVQGFHATTFRCSFHLWQQIM